MDRKNLDRRVLLAGLGGVMAGSMLARPAVAGVLESPPGPPSPTGLSLDTLAQRSSRTPEGCSNPCMPLESQPGTPDATYSITAPGSYYLTRNLHGEPGKNGIAILSPDVDLDLHGFHIFGAPGGGLTAGIYCSTENVTVYDGSIRGFYRGADFGAASHFVLWDVASLGAIEGVALGSDGECYDVDVKNAAGKGIALAGHGTILHECGVWNSGVGIGITQGGASGNLIISNTVIGCALPYDLGTNTHGPIIPFTPGDLSLNPSSSHPTANYQG